MRVNATGSPFGSRARTGSLLALQAMGESYPRQLARILGLRLAGVQKAIRSLEADGLVSGRTVGRVRLYRVNPRAYARPELERYLERLLDSEPGLRAEIASLRRRPRRSGKAL
ncbi:MAG TPA: winged helix-turn-helix domain-containing protein [Candidatus Omnitrophota bacterium]|jgi:DNA-binding MarR family transcriptional regulator|nr:winged helix-turn-helix domain-containing protein [Candidatus Omnitrophota bacterium]